MEAARRTEITISATSERGFEDAFREGVARATAALRGVSDIRIRDQRAIFEGGQVVAYQVNLDVVFDLDPEEQGRRIGDMENARTSKKWIVPRGQEIYERRVRPRLRPEDEGAFVVIDVESGDYEIDADEEEALARAEAGRPGALFYFSRVGSGGGPAPAHRIGAGASR